MRKYRKLVGYGLFAAIVSALSLFFCFPSEAVRQYLEGSAYNVDPAFALKINGVRPVLPFGLELQKADLSRKDQPGISLFKADSFVLRPSTRILVLKRPALRFDCRTYGGRIRGVIAFKTFTLGGPFQSDMEMTGIRLGQYPLLKERLKRECTGVLSGTVTYAGNRESLLQGSGKGDLSIINGSLKFSQPFLGVESMDFERMEIRMVLENQKISVAHFDCKGKQLEGTASGTIHLNTIIPRSSLNLKVAVKPVTDVSGNNGGLFDLAKLLGQRSKDGVFNIGIRGTIAKPRINFI
ncbi:MAG: type II secretion system protein GspN [Deltaproteobacteria bacterium]|nr:type II secretion system protein GspN [Deltaproteobacteria bacterium]